MPRGEHVGAKHLGVENMATHGVQGRAVMIDLAAHFGGTGRGVGYDDLMGVMQQDEVVVEPGDFVLLRTGFDRALLAMNKTPIRPSCSARPRRSTAATIACSSGSPTAGWSP